MYFDLDLEKDELNNENSYLILIEFLHWIILKIKEKFNIFMLLDDFVILNSTRMNKLSYHIVSNRKLCCENMHTLIEFIVYLSKEIEIESNDYFIWFYKNKKRFIFDLIPYGKDQLFRMINQSKFGKDHILRLTDDTNINFIDTLVRIYDKKECIVNLIHSNRESIKEARKEKKNQLMIKPIYLHKRL